MAYKRPNINRPEKPHPIQNDFGVYEQINTFNDPGWITPHLTELHDDGRFALNQFSNIVEDVKERDLSEYKPEVAKAKREESILKNKRSFMTYLKKHIDKAKSDVEGMRNKILRQTEPLTFNDPTKAMLQELKNQEIRSIIRNADPKHRHDMIAGNLAYIQALIDAPDNIIGAEHLVKLRRDFAFSQDPSLSEEEKDTTAIYKAVRQRAGEINATASKMLIYAKLDDPLPPSEFFEVFEPETDYTKVLAEKRIQSWNRDQDKIARQKELAEKQEGVNLQAGERAERKLRR